MKQYTVGCRYEYTDGCDFIKVEAENAFKAMAVAKKTYRATVRQKGTIYVEYIFAGWVECICNTYGFGASDAQLKKM